MTLITLRSERVKRRCPNRGQQSRPHPDTKVPHIPHHVPMFFLDQAYRSLFPYRDIQTAFGSLRSVP